MSTLGILGLAVFYFESTILILIKIYLGGSVEQIVQLCGEGVLKPFTDLLAAKVKNNAFGFFS